METAFQGLVLLKIFLILVQGCGTYGTQITAGKGRLEDIGRIHCPLAGSGTDQGMYLIDKEDVTAVRLDDFIDDTLKTFLEFALVLGASHQGTHIK